MSDTPAAAVNKLRDAADEAYKRYPNSCSHAAWYVIQQYLSNQPYMTANALLAQLECKTEWKPAEKRELAKLANEGVLVVGGLSELPNGHVIVVYPGDEKPAGGYRYNSGGKINIMRSRGLYAKAMSTSLGNWAGAKSSGDKTVWDPWANDSKFEKVKFWRLDLNEKESGVLCKGKN